MSRMIKPMGNAMEDMILEFRKYLEKLFDIDNKGVVFKKNIPEISKKAKVIASPKAWAKMISLVVGFDTEISWHGIVKRMGVVDDKETFFVEDIVVYPQEVSAATVTTDQEKYQEWLMGLDDDTFDNLRMQGHSHVSMDTSPSSVDKGYYGTIVKQMGPEDFYIFTIWNKKNSKMFIIYDFKNNVRFDTKDVEFEVSVSGQNMTEFLTEAKKMVGKVASRGFSGTGYYYNSGYSDDDYYDSVWNYPTQKKVKEEPKKEESPKKYISNQIAGLEKKSEEPRKKYKKRKNGGK